MHCRLEQLQLRYCMAGMGQRSLERAQRLLSGRRGQILGFAEKEDWPGWDEVQALVPEAELHDLIIELRSLTMGLGTYTRRFDHLAEARGR